MPKGTKKIRIAHKVGQQFNHKFQGGARHTMTVVRMGKGIGYEVNGNVFQSPTGAARHLAKWDVNGYRFWNMDSP
jgi:hypothetical protein